MLAPLGIGVLYGKKALLNEMNPFLMGGDMIEYVYEDHTTFAPLPNKFEAGTQNVGGVVGLRLCNRLYRKIRIWRNTKNRKGINKICKKWTFKAWLFNIIFNAKWRKTFFCYFI